MSWFTYNINNLLLMDDFTDGKFRLCMMHEYDYFWVLYMITIIRRHVLSMNKLLNYYIMR